MRDHAMQSAKVGCRKWVVALYLMSTGIKGTSSMKIYREIGIRQADLARPMGMHETILNAILRGRRPIPKVSVEQMHATLDVLERAEHAAWDARRRGLSEWRGSGQELADSL